MRHLLTVIAVLLAFACCTTEADRNRMEALLDRADSMNRAYIPMTDGIDSLLLEATRYYDRHGTANEQMRVHYLLGCAYRDKGEAPAALQSYQDAVDRADTLSNDCDYRRLMSIYGQMAELFHAQNLPEDELAQRVKYGKYALLIGDTLLYIRNLELLIKPYYLMKDTMRMLKVIQQAHELYAAHGYIKEAAAVFAPTIDYYITKGHLDKASELMKVYEELSGLFDPEGNIAAGREIYYYIKGTYYLKRHNLPLAEHWFRKLPSSKQKDAYKGLLSIFRLQNKYDSIAKYAYLYENALDSLHDKMQTDAIHQMSSLYNYQQFKEKAEKEEEEARQAKKRLWIISTIVVLLLILVSLYVLDYRKRKKEEMLRLYSDYLTVLSKYNQSADDYRQMKEDAVQFEKDKQQEMELLQQQLITYQNQLKSMDTSEKLSAFSQSDIVQTFHRKAERTRNIQEPDTMEWKNLYTMMTTEVPFVSTLIGGERVLSTKELHVCLLLILGFTNIEIYKLVNLTPQRFSNLKRIINKKLFEDDSAATIETNIKKRLLNVT